MEKTYINGTLEGFNAKEFMNKVYEAKTSLHTNREFDGKVYTIVVFGKPFMALDDTARWSIDIIVEDENGEQERIGNYKEMSNLTKEECIAKMESMVKEIIGEEQEEEEMTNTLAGNEYMNHIRMQMVKCNAQDDEIDLAVEAMKENGVDPEAIKKVEKKLRSHIKFNFSNGEVKAYRAWNNTISNSPDATVVEMNDFLWEREVAGFVLALRTAGLEKFYYTNHSTAVMENLHGFAAAGCKIGGMVTWEKDRGLITRHETETVLGLEIIL